MLIPVPFPITCWTAPLARLHPQAPGSQAPSPEDWENWTDCVSTQLLYELIILQPYRL